jgi:hypothetical protein
LLRHFGHHHIRRLMQAYGAMAVTEQCENATSDMTTEPYLYDEMFVIAKALQAEHIRMVSMFQPQK